MTAFDTHLNVVDMGLAVPTAEALDEGAEPTIEISLTVGQVLPFSQGPGQPPLVAPIGKVRFGLDRDSAVKYFTQALEAATALPVRGQVDIATNLHGVDVVAERLAKLKGTG